MGVSLRLGPEVSIVIILAGKISTRILARISLIIAPASTLVVEITTAILRRGTSVLSVVIVVVTKTSIVAPERSTIVIGETIAIEIVRKARTIVLVIEAIVLLLVIPRARTKGLDIARTGGPTRHRQVTKNSDHFLDPIKGRLRHIQL